MAIRYIVRPSGIVSTPQALADALGAQSVIKADAILRNQFDPQQDVFIGLPPARKVQGLTEGQLASYHRLREFYVSTKYKQRGALFDAGITVPLTRGISREEDWTPATVCVVRPMHHSAGSGFVLADSTPSNINYSTHYVSQLFHRTHEYRVIYSHGKRIATLLKKMPEDVSQEIPWTHDNGAFFVDIGHRVSEHKLERLGAYSALADFYVVQDAHLCGVDVMVNDTSYAVSEINFCPSLKLETRIAAVAARLKEYRGVS